MSSFSSRGHFILLRHLAANLHSRQIEEEQWLQHISVESNCHCSNFKGLNLFSLLHTETTQFFLYVINWLDANHFYNSQNLTCEKCNYMLGSYNVVPFSADSCLSLHTFSRCVGKDQTAWYGLIEVLNSICPVSKIKWPRVNGLLSLLVLSLCMCLVNFYLGRLQAEDQYLAGFLKYFLSAHASSSLCIHQMYYPSYIPF